MGALLTRAQLTALFPRALPGHIDAFVDQHELLFRSYGLDRNLFRVHFFLAQIGHESGGLSVESENLNYSAERLMQVWPRRFPTMEAAAPFARNAEKLGNFTYANRNGNGAEASGDGYRFRGRGYVQLTGRDGYREVGKLSGVNLVDAPDRACAPEHALKVALGFWAWKEANALCDTGDFERVTIAVNGGKIGWDDRLAWLDKVRRVLTSLPSRRSQPDPAHVILIQKALRAKGYDSVGAADGLIGARTLSAIMDWRARKGLGPGMIDDRLFDSLGIVEAPMIG